MDKLLIEGPTQLNGEVEVYGSKNATLPIMAATLLARDRFIIKGVPVLADVLTMIKILCSLGVKVKFGNGVLDIDTRDYDGETAPYEYVRTMRASICVLGSLLANKGCAKVSLPGGCVIGPRPIDLHIKGLEALGSEINVEHGYLIAKCDKLKGGYVYLGGPFGSSVLATCNVMTAATLAEGKTIIENAASESEVVDLAEFLIKMGARIKGYKTHTIEIDGVESLHGAEHTVISDRIEAGTYMLAAAATRGNVLVKGANIRHLGALVDKLRESGVSLDCSQEGCIRVKANSCVKAVDITTLPYPGFPTDLQAQMMVFLANAQGTGVITEKIYPERFIHVGELKRMGADIVLEGNNAIIKGVEFFSGAPVMASDLRASAALVIGGLIARGKSEILRVYHLDRGYSDFEEKLTMLGAKIRRVKE
ncbi:MAG: UDP-N-acetylglucosamine 1-carboxyvinyltransferase [Candidatus Omnitrophota bacterium]